VVERSLGVVHPGRDYDRPTRRGMISPPHAKVAPARVPMPHLDPGDA
jgi:hypothetical protein